MSKASEILNLTFLVDSERQVILEVLQRDEELKKKEEKRIRKLKNELLEIRRKGGNRRPQDNDRICTRCKKRLGFIFDRGELCQVCKLQVCNACRIEGSNGTWKCTVCAKIVQLQIVTGEWFFEERANRYSKSPSLGSDIVRRSIVRRPAVSRPNIGHKAEGQNGKTQIEPIAEEDSDTGSSPNNERRAITNGSKWNRFLSKKETTRSSVKKENNLEVKFEDVRNSEADGQSAPSNSSTPLSGSLLALEDAEVEIDGGNELNAIPQNSPALSRHSDASDYSRRGDGSESVVNFPASESVPENLEKKHRRKGSDAPSIAISRASISSDLSRSELDLSVAYSEKNEESMNTRSRSVPGGLNDELDYLDEKGEDTDESISVQYSNKGLGSLTSAFSSTSINSMMSVYSETGDYGNVRVKGDILLNISYSYKTGALNILVKECRNLAIGDEKKQRTDAYVKSYLLPDKSRQSKRKTGFRINTIDPVFNEILKYVISHTQLETRTLQLSVWHYDRFGRNSFLGEVEIPFDSRNLENPVDEWFPLQPRVDAASDLVPQYKGEMTVVLRYVPPERNLMLPLEQFQAKKTFFKRKKEIPQVVTGGALEVLIEAAKNLTAVKSGGTSDAFVKGYLLPDSKKSSKHKTPVIKKNVNPHWHHTLTYTGLYPNDLQNVGLELTVWDKEPITGNVFLGGVRLNVGLGMSYGHEADWMDAHGEEQHLWQRMIENPGVSVKGTLMLRSSMRKSKL